MKAEAAGFAAKGVATAGAAVAVFGLTWWAVAAAVLGAIASYHFEPEQKPKGALKLAFGIVAMGFAAAMLAVALPHVPMLGWSGAILVEVRAGLLGLTVRWLLEQAKRIGGNFNPRLQK